MTHGHNTINFIANKKQIMSRFVYSYGVEIGVTGSTTLKLLPDSVNAYFDFTLKFFYG